MAIFDEIRKAFVAIVYIIRISIRKAFEFLEKTLLLVWREVIIEILWRKVAIPMGTIGLQIIYITVKGMWYGPFGATEIFPDGILGPPDAEAVRSNPFKHYIPSQFMCNCVALFSGLGIGLRNYVQLVGMLLRGAWYGCFPTALHNADGFLSVPEDAYKTAAGRFCGILGAVIGLRTLVNLISVIPKSMWYGSAPQFFHLRDGRFAELPPDEPVYQGKSGPLFGVLGLVVGFRFMINMIYLTAHCMWYGPAPHFFNLKDTKVFDDLTPEVYKTRYGPFIGILGFGVGLRSIFSILSLAPFGLWYGCLGEVQIPLGLFKNLPNAATSNVTRVIFGVFGCIVGLRLLINVAYAIVHAIVLVIRMLLKGMYFGVAPALFHCSDGFFSQVKTEDVFCGSYEPVICRIGSIGGLLVGWRSILNALTIVPMAIYCGAVGKFYFKFGIIGEPQCPPLTVFGRALGSIFGIVLGFRNVLDLFMTAAFHLYLLTSLMAMAAMRISSSTLYFIYFSVILNLRHVAYLIAQGIWYGIAPQKVHFVDGMLEDPGKIEFAKGEEAICRLGYILGMFVGLRIILNGISLIVRTSYYGSSPEFFHCKDGWFGEITDEATYKSKSSRVLGLFGGFIGIRGLLNLITAVPSAIWYGCLPLWASVPKDCSLELTGQMETVVGKCLGFVLGGVVGVRFLVCTAAIALIGLWYGAFPCQLHFEDSAFGRPIPPVWKQIYGNVVGGVAGGIIGLRVVFGLATVFLRGIWYGGIGGRFLPDGLLGVPRSPPKTWIGTVAGTILGGGIGVRNYLDIVFMGLRGFWFGAYGQLSDVDGNVEALSLHPEVSACAKKSLQNASDEIKKSRETTAGDEPIGAPDFETPVQQVCDQQPSPTPPPVTSVSIPELQLVKTMSGSSIESTDLCVSCFDPPRDAQRHGMGTILGKTAGALTGAAIWGGIGFGLGHLSDTSRDGPFWIYLALSAGAAFGTVIGYVGLRNFLSPGFYAQTVGPFLRRTFWLPFGVPALEALVVTVGLIIYFPFYSLVIFVRKYPRSLYHLLMIFVMPCSSRATNDGEKRYEQDKLRIGKALFRALAAPFVFVIVYRLTSDTQPLAIPIAVASMLLENVIANFLIKMLPSSRYNIESVMGIISDSAKSSLTREELYDINYMFRYRVYMAKIGKGSDPVGVLRFWIRDLGLRSPDEKKLKSMHDLFRRGHIVVILKSAPSMVKRSTENLRLERKSLGNIALNAPLSKSLADLLGPTPPKGIEFPEYDHQADEASNIEVIILNETTISKLHNTSPSPNHHEMGNNTHPLETAACSSAPKTVAQLDAEAAVKEGSRAEIIETDKFKYEISFENATHQKVVITKFAFINPIMSSKLKGGEVDYAAARFITSSVEHDREEMLAGDGNPVFNRPVPPITPLIAPSSEMTRSDP